MEYEYKESARPDSTELALERTFLAYERTQMAWTRTAVSLITFGFTLYKFFEYVNEQGPTKHAPNILGARSIGLLMIGIGVLSLLLAAIQHRVQIKKLQKQYFGTPVSVSFILALLISALGAMTFLATIFR